MLSSRRRSRRAARHMPEISLTPLIDTALVLLVIFMVATPIMKNSLTINLPKGHMKEEQKGSMTAAVVSIDAKERLRLNDDVVSLEVLLDKVSRHAKQSKDGKVYVHCDQKASSGTLVQVIDAIKYVAGVEHVVLSTDRA